MNRSIYFNSIEERLSLLVTRLEMRGGLNILDLHLHSENFYLHFLKLLYGWELQNLNATHQNTAGVDLIDTTNKIIAQVSATATKQKIEASLAKGSLSSYKGYCFKFISISKDAEELRTKKFSNPHNLTFAPPDDILDVPSILSFVNMMPIDRLKEICEFLKKELRNEPDPEKVESNLTTIINVLSKEDWSHGSPGLETVPYDIEAKIAYNHLDKARDFIDEYKVHYARIDKIYSEFDRQGANKSASILNGIRTEYVALGSVEPPDQYFLAIVEKVVQKVRTSANYTSMPEEELALCAQILVVDAFIRCKIFKNPLGNADANS